MVVSNRILLLPVEDDNRIDETTLEWPAKLAGSTLDYGLDFAAWQAFENTTLVRAEISTTSNLKILSRSYQMFEGQKSRIILRISGGDGGSTEWVMLQLIFANGRVKQVAIGLPIIPVTSEFDFVDLGDLGAVLTMDGDPMTIGGASVDIGVPFTVPEVEGVSVNGEQMTIGGSLVQLVPLTVIQIP